MSHTDILLIYPQLGSWDNLVRDLPLSLLYAAVDSVKNGFSVKIFDCRLYKDNWKNYLDVHLCEGCTLVGLSVMTGNPILTSLSISKYIKENYEIPIVWGGPHPTILPEQTLENSYIDYIIRDWGSKPLYQLISYLKNQSVELEKIEGLGFKKSGDIILNNPTCRFEMPEFQEIPYHLVDIGSGNYNRQYDNQLYFPIFTAVGCPYKCTFCMSPAVYKKIKGKKWVPYDVDVILDHIQYLLERYEFPNLQILDDDSFVDLDRMYQFFLKYIERGYHNRLTLDFRGIRINELDKMDDDYLSLMGKANVGMLAMGVESGSDETLQRMGKGITVEQILRVSRKLIKYTTFKPHYNIFCGIPGETYEDLVKTKELMVTLARENPHCLLGFASDWKPLPGSVMTETAVRDYNLKLPESLEGWAAIDSFDAKEIQHPWYTKEIKNYIRLLQVAGTVLGQKMETLSSGEDTRTYRILQMFNFFANLYKPILKLRLRYNFSSFLIEYHIRDFLMKWYSKF